MEKPTPHYELGMIKAQVAHLGPAAFTKTALDGGRDMGLTSSEMLSVLAALTRRNFYKSMTSDADHRIWQDVYHSPNTGGKRGLHQVHDSGRGAGDPV